MQSSQARKRLMGESWDAFVQNPLTGVGAGQFKDWNPQGRVEAWHEAHNVWLQVAAELGILGVGAFLFLVFRAFYAVFQTPPPAVARAARHRRRAGRRPATPTSCSTRYSAAMAASLAGWFVCAFFGSMAYNWTFYYLLAFAAAPREILRDSASPRRTLAPSPARTSGRASGQPRCRCRRRRCGPDALAAGVSDRRRAAARSRASAGAPGAAASWSTRARR